MPQLPNSDLSKLHSEVLKRAHTCSNNLDPRRTVARRSPSDRTGGLAPISNVRGAPQGGLIAVLIDVCAGRLAYESCDHESGFSTATSDLNIHFLSPVVVGPARADAQIVRRGRSNFVLQVAVTDVGRDDKLAAVSTIAFTVLPPRS